MISPTAEYALRAIVAIAQSNGDATITPHIAELTKVPAGYLSKVLQTLRRAGLVESRRGLGGGFTLARPASDMTVLEVVNAVDPIQRIHHCPLGIESHGASLCPLHERLDEAMAEVERSFAATTIAELLAQPGRSTPFCEREKRGGVQPGIAVAAKPTSGSSRRLDALIKFSHDHTRGLAVAKHLTEGADRGPAAARDALREFLDAWSSDLVEHFDQEERFLLPVIEEAELAMRLRQEHATLRAMANLAELHAENPDLDTDWVRAIGKLLHDHIRWEERQLFPWVERFVDAPTLMRLAQKIGDTQSAALGAAGRKNDG
jgi:Rrf2 family protein